MKQIFYLLCFSIFCLSSCDTKSPTTTSTPSIDVTKENPKIPRNGTTKIPAQKSPQSGPVVESEVRVEEAPVNDQSVNYGTFAQAICDCAAASNALNDKMQAYSQAGNSEQFRAMVPKVNQAYEESVECAKQRVRELNSEYSIRKLFKRMKGTCGTYHDKLVSQMIFALKR